MRRVSYLIENSNSIRHYMKIQYFHFDRLYIQIRLHPEKEWIKIDGFRYEIDNLKPKNYADEKKIYYVIKRNSAKETTICGK